MCSVEKKQNKTKKKKPQQKAWTVTFIFILYQPNINICQYRQLRQHKHWVLLPLFVVPHEQRHSEGPLMLFIICIFKLCIICNSWQVNGSVSLLNTPSNILTYLWSIGSKGDCLLLLLLIFLNELLRSLLHLLLVRSFHMRWRLGRKYTSWHLHTQARHVRM